MTDLLYPYGPEFNAVSPKVDDGGTDIIPLLVNVPIFGDVYTTLFVSMTFLLQNNNIFIGNDSCCSSSFCSYFNVF